MQYVIRRPPPGPGLRGVVDQLWSLRDAPEHARERILPTGTVELVVNLHADWLSIHRGAGETPPERFREAVVSGPYARAFEIDARAHVHVIGVHFAPGGAARLLGVPAGALANAHVALEDLWGCEARTLRQRLLDARTLDLQMDVLESVLVERMSRSRPPRPQVIAGLAKLERGARVGDVVAEVGLSRRRFIEIFTEDVGMTPKRYAMVQRFQRALEAAAAHRVISWGRIAALAGYCDQAHLCHDAVELTGLSPSELVARRNVEVKDHHVALVAASGGQIPPSQVEPRPLR